MTATRLVINKNERSLIDYAKPLTPPTPPNKLFSIREIDNGLRFKFRDKVLPNWFAQVARRYNYAMVDNLPTKKRGRVVSWVDNSKYDSHFSNTEETQYE